MAGDDFDPPDPAKNALNLQRHGLSLGEAERFDFDTADVLEDDTETYGEQRFRAVGRLIGGPIVVFVFTYRDEKIRAISIRKADAKERRKWLNS